MATAATIATNKANLAKSVAVINSNPGASAGSFAGSGSNAAALNSALSGGGSSSSSSGGGGGSSGGGSTPSAGYVVKSGDTLSAIAKSTGKTVAELVSYNGITNPNLIYPGQNINLSGTSPYKPSTVVGTVGSPGYIASSDQQRESDNNVTKNIGTLKNTYEKGISNLRSTYEASQKVLDDYIAKLETRRANEIGNIEADYANQKKITEGKQTQDFGAASSSLARMGGYLGESASSIGYLRNLNEQNRIEIANLEAKKISAITEANSAIDDKDFALAQLKVKAAQDYESEINNRYNEHFNQVRTLTNDSLTREKATLDIMDTKSKQLAPAIFAELTGDPVRDAELINRVAQAQGIDPTVLAGAVNALKQDTQVVEVNDRKVLVNSKTGQVVKDLGSTGSKTPVKLTGAERAADAISKYSAVFIPGASLPDKTPILDAEGFITPKAWKAAIADAPNQGLNRKEFIQQFGHLLYTDDGEVDPKYGLTPAELKLING